MTAEVLLVASDVALTSSADLADLDLLLATAASLDLDLAEFALFLFMAAFLAIAHHESLESSRCLATAASLDLPDLDLLLSTV